MASDISPKAEIDPRAKIGDNCKIYPFVYVEGDVVIGDNCVLHPFVSVLNGARIGNDNNFFQGSVVGARPQDFDYKGERTPTVIGNSNIIRENVVINRATHPDGRTLIGDNNFLMEGSHVSHDTHIGNFCVLGYATKIAGDCEIGNGVIFSSGIAEGAGTRVGDAVMIEAGTDFSRDVPPYVIIGGSPNAYNGVNTTMMTSYGIEPRVQKHIANAYRLVFQGQESVFDAVNQIKQQVPDSKEIQNIVNFINSTKLGIICKM